MTISTKHHQWHLSTNISNHEPSMPSNAILMCSIHCHHDSPRWSCDHRHQTNNYEQFCSRESLSTTDDLALMDGWLMVVDGIARYEPIEFILMNHYQSTFQWHWYPGWSFSITGREEGKCVFEERTHWETCHAVWARWWGGCQYSDGIRSEGSVQRCWGGWGIQPWLTVCWSTVTVLRNRSTAHWA